MAGSTGWAIKHRPPSRSHSVDKGLWIIGQGSQFLIRAKDEQMVFLRVTILVVYLFAGQHEGAFLSIPIIGVHSLYQDIMVSDQENIHAGFESGQPQFSVCTGTV